MALIASSLPVPNHEITIGGEVFNCRYLCAADSSQFVDLHQAIFKSTFNHSQYQWKYLDRGNPSLGLWNGAGKLIAHCGGLQRELCFESAPILGLQITDVMVHPQWRAILTRRGPFYWVSYWLYQNQIGEQAKAKVGYGFPSHRHLELAVKLRLLLDGGSIWQMQWATVRSSPTWFWYYRKLTAASSDWENVLKSSWQRMQKTSQDLCLGSRTFNELIWRYHQHPQHQHIYLGLKRPWSSQIIGVAIIRYPDSNKNKLLWLDWIGPPSALRNALAMVRNYSYDCHGINAEVEAWGSEQIRQALKRTLQYSEQRVAGLGLPIQSCLSASEITEKPWWWMAGDTDFL